MDLPYKKLDSRADFKPHAHMTDAGLDLTCTEDTTLPPHIPVKIGTGIAVAIPEGHVGLIWDKSSIGMLGVKVCGGVIDSAYRGEIIVVLLNCTNTPISFPAGKKIAQLIVQKFESCEPEEVTELDETTRGDGGFGSTGA